MDKIQFTLYRLRTQKILIDKEKEYLNKEIIEVFYQGLVRILVGCSVEILAIKGNIIVCKGAAINLIESETKSVVEFISKEEMMKLIPIQEHKIQATMDEYQAKLVKCQSSIESLRNKLSEGKRNFSRYQENQNMLAILKAFLEDLIFRINMSSDFIKNIPRISDQEWIHFLETKLLNSESFTVELDQIIDKIEMGILKDYQILKEIIGNEELKKEYKLTEMENNLIYSNMVKAEEEHKITEITKCLEKLSFKLPLSIENNTTTSCHACQTNIDFQEFPMFCQVCNLWFCWLCSSKKEFSKAGTKSLIHPHNLVLVTVNNKETIQTISNEKFGDPNMTFEADNYDHKALCDICGLEINFCYRWICLQCKIENKQDFFDMCNSCKVTEIEKIDLPLLSKIEEVFTRKNHTKDHVFLRVCFGNGNYYKY